MHLLGSTQDPKLFRPVPDNSPLRQKTLVRRLLENGANSSFVNRMADAEASLDSITADPVAGLAKEQPLRNPRIPQ